MGGCFVAGHVFVFCELCGGRVWFLVRVVMWQGSVSRVWQAMRVGCWFVVRFSVVVVRSTRHVSRFLDTCLVCDWKGMVCATSG